MFHVVVRSITIGNIFHCQPCDEFYDAGIARFEHPVDLLILLLKLSNKRIDDYLYRIKHCSLQPERLPCGATTRVKLSGRWLRVMRINRRSCILLRLNAYTIRPGSFGAHRGSGHGSRATVYLRGSRLPASGGASHLRLPLLYELSDTSASFNAGARI